MEMQDDDMQLIDCLMEMLGEPLDYFFVPYEGSYADFKAFAAHRSYIADTSVFYQSVVHNACNMNGKALVAMRMLSGDKSKRPTIERPDEIPEQWRSVMDAAAIQRSQCKVPAFAMRYIAEFVIFPITHGLGWASVPAEERQMYIDQLKEQRGSFKDEMVHYFIAFENV